MQTQSDQSNSPAKPTLKRIVLVGHCGMDATSLRRAASHAAADAQVLTANDEQSLEPYLNDESLLLVNRELDGRFRVPGGIELIAALANENPALPMMLISNFSEAQQAAREAGALPGFGKSQAHSDQTARLLADAVGSL